MNALNVLCVQLTNDLFAIAKFLYIPAVIPQCMAHSRGITVIFVPVPAEKPQSLFPSPRYSRCYCDITAIPTPVSLFNAE